MKLRDRIIGLRRVKASDIRPNPKNWRTHPADQKDALKGLLADVGFAVPLVARELNDGTLELIDGHLRAETAADSEVPVVVLDVNEEEADKLLATMDPLSSLAGQDDEALIALLQNVDSDSAAVQKMLSDLVDLPEVEPEPAEDDSDKLVSGYQILVECDTEKDQAALLERLTREGVKCRSLIS